MTMTVGVGVGVGCCVGVGVAVTTITAGVGLGCGVGVGVAVTTITTGVGVGCGVGVGVAVTTITTGVGVGVAVTTMTAGGGVDVAVEVGVAEGLGDEVAVRAGSDVGRGAGEPSHAARSAKAQHSTAHNRAARHVELKTPLRHVRPGRATLVGSTRWRQTRCCVPRSVPRTSSDQGEAGGRACAREAPTGGDRFRKFAGMTDRGWVSKGLRRGSGKGAVL